MTSKDLSHSEGAGSIVPAQDLKGLLETMASDLETPLSSSKTDRPTPLYKESRTIYVLLDCSGSMTGGEKLSQEKRRFPWGSEAPNPGRANLGWRVMGTVDVTECAEAGCFRHKELINS